MANTFNVNTDEVVKLTNNLEKINRSAMPVAIRKTINEAAIEAKNLHVAKTFDNQFTIRKKKFIESHTWANKSPNTFNLPQMVSEMGVVSGKPKADGLALQELGGTEKNRDYIPTKTARRSKSANKLVSKNYYRTKMKQRNKRPIKKYATFAKYAFRFGVKSIILFNNVLVEIRKITKGGVITFRNLYAVDAGRNIEVKKAPFLAPAGMLASKNIANNYVKIATERINRVIK